METDWDKLIKLAKKNNILISFDSRNEEIYLHTYGNKITSKIQKYIDNFIESGWTVKIDFSKFP
jgi:molybdenum cofactor biosynthesis enzyme MoaA